MVWKIGRFDLEKAIYLLIFILLSLVLLTVGAIFWSFLNTPGFDPAGFPLPQVDKDASQIEVQIRWSEWGIRVLASLIRKYTLSAALLFFLLTVAFALFALMFAAQMSRSNQISLWGLKLEVTDELQKTREESRMNSVLTVSLQENLADRKLLIEKFWLRYRP